MTITISVPDAQATRVLDAVAFVYRYDPASGLTKAQFAKQQMIAWVTSAVTDAEKAQRRQAIEAQLVLTTYPDPGIS